MQTIEFNGIMRRNLGKGEPIAKIGATGSGKTTLDEVLALSPQTQELLELREAEGKGSLITTELIVTDDQAVPEEGLIVYGEINKKSAADVNDDNEFFGGIIYSATKELIKGGEEKYKSKIIEEFNASLNHPANNSLAYKIKGMSEEVKEKVEKLLYSFDKTVIKKIYNETIAKTPKKDAKKSKQIFSNLMSLEQKNQTIISELWNLVVDVINTDVEEFRKYLLEKEESVCFTNKDDSNIKFMVYITTSERDEYFRNFILKSEYGSKEYLFRKLSIIFRGRDDLFGNEFKDLTTVGEVEGKAIHVIRLIDTQGIMHAEDAVVDSEVSRLIDIFSVYHCKHIILVSNSYVNNTQKDSGSVIEKLLQECKIELNIHVLYTHFDQRLERENIKSSTTSKFSRRKSEVDWNSIYEKTINEQNNQMKIYEEFLKINNSKKKPKFKSVNRAAIYTNDDRLNDLLEENELMYESSMNNILMDIYEELKLDGDKIKVLYSDEEGFKNLFTSSAVINIDALFTNLIKCKGKKLYASTVRACINHWLNYGDRHKSIVNEDNIYGYENIKTEFVREIRNIPRNVIKDVNASSLNEILVNSDCVNEFTDLINKAFKDSLGRYLARAIGEDSYVYGFCIDSEIYKTQYNRFAQMIDYVQTDYFSASKVKVSDKFVNAMNLAVEKCILDVISTKCIVVY